MCFWGLQIQFHSLTKIIQQTNVSQVKKIQNFLILLIQPIIDFCTLNSIWFFPPWTEETWFSKWFAFEMTTNLTLLWFFPLMHSSNMFVKVFFFYKFHDYLDVSFLHEQKQRDSLSNLLLYVKQKCLSQNWFFLPFIWRDE